MNWEAAAAIGQILGALAVLATLVYLAIQTGQTQRIAKAQASQNTNGMYNELLALIASSPTLASQVHRMESGEELSGAEYVQVRSLLQMQLNAWENIFLQSKQIEHIRVEDVEKGLRTFMQIPGAAEAWEFHKSFGPDDGFVQFVEKVISREGDRNDA